MSDTKDKIVKAALDVFRLYSVQRTTMTDIANEAGLSRQTLYSTLGSKEEVVAEVIGYAEGLGLKAVKQRLVECKSLSEQLDVYFEEMVVIPFEQIQKDPCAMGIWNNSDISGHRAVKDAKQANFQFLSELLLPYTNKLGEVGQSPAQLAHFVIFVSRSLKVSPITREALDSHLPTLKTTVLTMALGRG